MLIRQRPATHSHLLGEAWKQKCPNDNISSLINSKTANSLKISKSQQPKQGSHEELPRMIDSYCEVNLPFMDDQRLREDYISIHGGIRIGKLLEDLDALAASIAYAHCHYGPGRDTEVMLVTAAVDRMEILNSFHLTSFQNIKMSGFVTMVGKSSMEITMAIERETAESKGLAAIARFIFVARTPDGSSSMPINPLRIDSEADEHILKAALKRKEERSSRVKRKTLELDELSLMDSLLLPRSTNTPKLTMTPMPTPMKNTVMKSVRVCHPQQRNIHNRIFGGYLMREALELAYATVVHFMDGDPMVELQSIDAIRFVHPVPIGSILEMKAMVCRTASAGNLIHLELVADVLLRKNASLVEERRTTNVFHYTFRATSSTTVKEVVPESYEEFLKFISC